MPGIVTRDEIVAALAGARTFLINKASVASQAAGAFASMWRATGTPAQGAIPAAAAVCTDALAGSLGAIPAPGVGQRNALLQAALASTNAGTLVQFVDRLAHMGGLSGTVAAPTAQTVGVSVVSLAGTRCADDFSDVRWWLEIYTAIGTTAVTATIAYTDAGGTSRTTTASIGGASPANQPARLVPIIPQASTPLPIRSIESVTLSATTGTAGSFGVTADRVLSEIACPPVANYGGSYDWAQLGAPTIDGEACVALTVLCSATSTGALTGSAKVGTA